ncbi:hypothetical protein F5Y03DRAFT_405684 [Xylaria venustula]|nr:hypothetical protein F5Y03DRAFT_405684 [Xylaria venustula]
MHTTFTILTMTSPTFAVVSHQGVTRRSPSNPRLVEPKMLQTHLTHRLRQDMNHAWVKQCLIPYHVTELKSGTSEMKEFYYFLQDHYTSILGLSIGEIRPYIKHVDLKHLERFSVKMVNSNEKQEPPDDSMYDSDGFYIEGNDDETTTDAESGMDSYVNWFRSNGEDKPDPVSSPSGEASSSIYPNPPEFDITPTQTLNVNITIPTSPVAESTSNGEIEEPHSEDLSLEGLLRKLGASSRILRTNEVLELDANKSRTVDHIEHSMLQIIWNKKVELSLNEWDFHQRGLDPEEANYLDSWDEGSNQFVWQKEGIFLCRLAEIVSQPEFIDARRTRLVMRERNQTKTISWPPRFIHEGFSSPLRKEFKEGHIVIVTEIDTGNFH